MMQVSSANACLACERIDLIKEGKNPYFVHELETGYVVLGDYQFFNGYSLLVCKKHVSELHELEPAYRKQFLWEMSQVAEAVYNAFKPIKLNYELLGNEVRHMHWHIFPRYRDDPLSQGPVWSIAREIRNSDAAKVSGEVLEDMKGKLKASLEEVLEKS